MPKSRDYTSQDVVRAIEAVKEGLSYRGASDLYNVSSSTLERKVKNLDFEKQARGPAQTLTVEEEKYLVKWLKHCQDAGFPRQDAALVSEHYKKG